MAAEVQKWPLPCRSWSFDTSEMQRLYLWGGLGDTEPKTIYLFNNISETWTERITNGPHYPPKGLNQGGCAVSRKYLFIYGGLYGSILSGTLYKINFDDWTWEKLATDAAGGPGRKCRCVLITHNDQLFLFGGCYGWKREPETKQHGALYEDGWTNEFHSYSLTTGMWSSPSVIGSRPSPCTGFSLTKIDEEHAVLFGGYIPSTGLSADVHVLCLSTTSWSHLPRDPRVSARSDHIAVCLGYGGQYKRVLVSGGDGGCDRVLDDMWLLDPQTGTWEEVPVNNKKILQRYGHSAASFCLNSKCFEVVSFGGLQRHRQPNTSNDVAMRFEFKNTSSSGNESWILTDTSDHTQLGSQQRIEEKRKIMEPSNCRANELEEQLKRRAERLERMAEESRRRAEESFEHVAEIEQSLQQKIRERDITAKQQRDLIHSLRQQLRDCERCLEASNSRWVVRRNEIEMIGPELGRGGWATVCVATFRGLRVAAKTIHEQIVSPHNIQLFRREMTMASRLRHPNLVQFIGATTEGSMVILTELMPTSLRAQLESHSYLQPTFVKIIGVDVASALSYLHQMQPDPIIHRDISSANVLMEPLLGGRWRAKLSDYGTVNRVCQLQTNNPGSPIYAAPEASDPHLQSPKMDIFSFGALILEMLTGQLPAPEDRPSLLLRVFHDQLLELIQRCLNERTEDRPDAADIIELLK